MKAYDIAVIGGGPAGYLAAERAAEAGKKVLLAIDDTISPRMNILKEPDSIEKYMFSNRHMPKMDDRPAEVSAPREENPRVQRLKKRSRDGIKAVSYTHLTLPTN